MSIRYINFLFLVLILSCETGKLTVIADLPQVLNEVSGMAIDTRNNLIWMVNDSGNKPKLYGLSNTAEIKKVYRIEAKNDDWEDLTIDPKGNVYIGNFGNNNNKRKNLTVLKINAEDLTSNKKVLTPDVISFSYPQQKKFPPKKSKRHFDCEAFFYFDDYLYLFTKSRAPKHPEITNMYKIPANKGKYKAEFLATFTTCKKRECHVTSAAVNTTSKQMALLTEHSVFIFSYNNSQNFLSSKVKQYVFNHKSQKESVAFKNDTTLYITDEYFEALGRNLYEFHIESP